MIRETIAYKNDHSTSDRSVKFPQGMAYNLLVKVGNFVFLVYFVILNMVEDREVLLQLLYN